MELIIKQKFFAIADKYRVFDTNNNQLFTVKSRFFSPFYRKKYIVDAATGQTLMTLRRKLFTLHADYLLFDAEGNELAYIYHPFFTIRNTLKIEGKQSNLVVQGNFFHFNWTLVENGVPVGSVSKGFFQINDKYRLNINNPADAPFFVALVIAIDNLWHDNGKNH